MTFASKRSATITGEALTNELMKIPEKSNNDFTIEQ